MSKLLVIGLGGSVGAIARYLISSWVHSRYEGHFPYGTLIVNLIGCLILGVLMTLVEQRETITPHMRHFLCVGLIGSLTTFSTFGYETVELVNKDKFDLALASVATNVVLGLLAVVIGRAVVLKAFAH